MKYNSATAPKWANPEHTAIELQVDFEGLGVVPFGARPDADGNGPELFARAIAGDFGPIEEYVATAPTQAQINAAAMRELAAADAASVRGLREFVLAKFAGDTALPAQLVASETKAQTERAKIK